MAKIQRPKKKKTRTKGAPPKENLASQNLTKSDPQDLITMNFKVPSDFRREYKQLALDLNMSMVDILRKSFEKYKENIR